MGERTIYIPSSVGVIANDEIFLCFNHPRRGSACKSLIVKEQRKKIFHETNYTKDI